MVSDYWSSFQFIEALERIVSEWKNNPKGNDYDIQDFYRQFLKCLYRSGELKKLVYEAQTMAETFSKDPYPLEWICKLWVEFVAEEKNIGLLKDSINKYVSRLELVGPSAGSSIFMARGAIYLVDGELGKAREELTKGE